VAPDTRKFQRAEIVSRKDVGPDLWVVRLRPETRLAFKPGQYATLGVEHNGRMIERAYSICSSPLEDELEFFFELVPEGELTPRLYRLRPGEALWMRRQAKGLFTLDTRSGHTQHLLVATVTGVAPYVSMVRTLAASGSPANLRIVLLHGASRSWEFAYREELESLAQGSDWFHYIPTVSRPWEDPAWRGEVGRVEDVLRKYTDRLGLDPPSTTAYLCGHPQMIEAAKGILKRRGFPKESVREEVYWIPRKAVSPAKQTV
jgi:ferredoxin--NADP+ reductase